MDGGMMVGMSRGLMGEYGTPLPICIFRTIPGMRPGGKSGYGGGGFSATFGGWVIEGATGGYMPDGVMVGVKWEVGGVSC